MNRRITGIEKQKREEKERAKRKKEKKEQERRKKQREKKEKDAESRKERRRTVGVRQKHARDITPSGGASNIAPDGAKIKPPLEVGVADF